MPGPVPVRADPAPSGCGGSMAAASGGRARVPQAPVPGGRPSSGGEHDEAPCGARGNSGR